MSISNHNAPPLSPSDEDIKGIGLQAAQPQHHLNNNASSHSLSDTKGDPAVASSANSTNLATVDSEGRALYNGCSIIPMWKTYILIFGLTVMTAANSAAIQAMNVAVGFIAVALKFEPAAIQWIVSAYTLSSGCLLLLFIPLCIQFGHREIFIFATVVYTAGAIGCACAQTSNAFIALRVVMGVGACSGIPSGLGVIANTLPVVHGNKFRALALGVFAMGAPLGSAMGTVFGGLPTGLSAIKWRGIFAVLAGLSTLAFATTIWTMPKNPKSKVPGGPDWLGTALITTALTLFLFCMSQGPAVGWSTPYLVALLVIGILLFPTFVFYEIWIERKGLTPMLRMSKYGIGPYVYLTSSCGMLILTVIYSFRRGRFGVINLLGFFGFMSFALWDYFCGLFFTQVKGLGAVDVMLRFLPQTIGGFVGGISSNWLLRRVSTQIVFCLGALFAALGATIFAVAKPEDNYWEGGQFFAFFLSINGACYVYASSILYSVSVVVPSEIGAAGGLYQVMTSLAPAFGNVIGTIVQQNQLKKAPEDPANVFLSFKHAFATAAAFGYFALIAAIPGLWGIGILNKTGESARVEELVVHHHEDEVIGVKEKQHDPEAVTNVISARSN